MVIFIIALLSVLTIANYREGQKRYAVDSAVQRMAADLRRAQNLALAPMDLGAAPSPRGYGINTNSSNSYLFFHHDSGSRRYSGGASTILDSIFLPAGVTISPVNSDVYFIPPDPTTFLNGASSGSLVFTLTNGSYSRQIIVEAGGKIDIQ
ncbi:GspH/FimT family protein [Patescibacteria group bacterium]|nr:GspH/FimT family protein [Patescibacteria group bacterium]